MWDKNITSIEDGKYRSLNGAADENVFIGKASKAGFFCFFKVWRDMPYDAVLDHEGILYRVEVKGSSTGKFDLTRGGRSGAQINRAAESRKRRIERIDCDFVVCVDSGNGDCYVLPVDILDIVKRNNLSDKFLAPFKEKWKLFIHGDNRLGGALTRDGLCTLSLEELNSIAKQLDIIVPKNAIKFTKGNRITISDEREKAIMKIWLELCTRD